MGAVHEEGEAQHFDLIGFEPRQGVANPLGVFGQHQKVVRSFDRLFRQFDLGDGQGAGVAA
ncbi:hypothetical protein D3C85_1575980 [compost metagenome]